MLIPKLLQPLFRYVCEEGCGLTLEEFLASEHLARTRQYYLSAGKDHRATALEMRCREEGHFKTGLRLNGAGEQSLDRVCSAKPAPQLYALVSALGHCLVEYAATHLPPELQRMAAEFRQTLSVPKREEILRSAEELLGELGETIESKPGDAGQIDSIFLPPDPNKILPHRFLRAGTQPNCLGLTSVLLGFASRCQARTLMVDPLVHFTGLVEQRQRELEMIMYRLCNEHGLFGERWAMKRVLRLRSWLFMRRFWQSRFHGSIAIDLSMDRWMLLDPYFHLLTFVPPEWRVHQRVLQLDMPERVVPGLSVIVSDEGAADDVVHNEACAIYRKLEPAVIEAKVLRDALAAELTGTNRDISCERIAEIVAASTMFQRVLRETYPDGKLPEDMTAEELALSFLLGDKEEGLEIGSEEWIFDRLDATVGLGLEELLVSFVGNSHKAAETENVCHPIVELSKPYYGLGMRVLSDIRAFLGEPETAQAVLDDACFTQFGLYNRLRRGEDIAWVCDALPHVHESLRQLMKRRDQMSLERELVLCQM